MYKKSNKAESRRRRKIHQILDLVLDINGLQRSRASITGNHPTAFFFFCGHTGDAEVTVHKNGWEPKSKPEIDMDFHIDSSLARYGYASMDDVIKVLKREKARRRQPDRAQINNLHPYDNGTKGKSQ